MLRLIVFPPAFGSPSASPFSTKVLCLMKMAGAAASPADTVLRRRLIDDKALIAYRARARAAIFPETLTRT